METIINTLLRRNGLHDRPIKMNFFKKKRNSDKQEILFLYQS